MLDEYFIQGFMQKCAEAGLGKIQAHRLLKLAIDTSNIPAGMDPELYAQWQSEGYPENQIHDIWYKYQQGWQSPGAGKVMPGGKVQPGVPRPDVGKRVTPEKPTEAYTQRMGVPNTPPSTPAAPNRTPLKIPPPAAVAAKTPPFPGGVKIKAPK